MAREPRVIRTLKGYYVKRRLDGHRDWRRDYWRELFQNGIDAGAGRIDITVSTARGKGVFGGPAATQDVVRTTFKDDGRGMTAEVLEKVFFSPGESTKGAGDTGGFGTARLMTCFSQDSYRFRTNGIVGEGAGDEYNFWPADEALSLYPDWIEAAVARGDADGAEALRSDMAAIEAEGKRKGCAFEIDIVPVERDYGRHTTPEFMLEKLDEWLSMSQVPCKVFVNGEEKKLKANKGPVRRELFAEVDGNQVKFATIHTSQGDKAAHKGKVMVRLNGSLMYAQNTSAEIQVIVELEPSIAKRCLTDNRGGLTWPYESALDNFVQEFARDRDSAMNDVTKIVHTELKGGKGKQSIDLRATLAAMFAPGAEIKLDFSVQADQESRSARYVGETEFERDGYGGASASEIDLLFEQIRAGNPTFLDNYPVQYWVKSLIADVQGNPGRFALKFIDKDLSAYMVSEVRRRSAAAAAEKVAVDAAMADLNDLHILVHNPGDDKRYKDAIRRHNPKTWQRQGSGGSRGRGLNAHLLYTCWSVCARHALETVMTAERDAKPTKFGTGWVFKRKDDYTGHAMRACYMEHSDVHLLLLNPTFDDGSAAWDLTKDRRIGLTMPEGQQEQFGVSDLIAVACHEAVHRYKEYHDERFANLFTQVIGMFPRAKALAEMREAVAALKVAYGSPKSLVQMMDAPDASDAIDGPGDTPSPKVKAKTPRKPRPAEVVLAQSFPVTVAVAGLMSAPENAHLDAVALQSVIPAAVTQIEPGVVEVDTALLQAVETRLVDALAFNREPDLSENPAIAAIFESAPRAADGCVRIEDLPAPETPVFDNSDLGMLDDFEDAIAASVGLIESPGGAAPSDDLSLLDEDADAVLAAMPPVGGVDLSLLGEMADEVMGAIAESSNEVSVDPYDRALAGARRVAGSDLALAERPARMEAVPARGLGLLGDEITFEGDAFSF